MAEFIEEEKIINKYVENYVDQTTDFSKYLEGSPTFVTYYSKDDNASTEDRGLENTVQLIGKDSSIRYNKINNFPLFNIGEITSPDLQFEDDTGLTHSFESDAVVLPNLIRPKADDHFTINYLNRKILFRVSKPETGSINNQVIFKISFYNSGTPEDLEFLDKNQVTKTYNTIYNNIGKEGKIILEENTFLKLRKLEKLLEKIKKSFINDYYSEDFNSFLFFDNYDYYYSKNMIEFIKKNKLFIKDKTFMKNIFIEHLLHFSNKDYFIFEESIFNAIMKRDVTDLSFLICYSEEINEENTSLTMLKNLYSVKNLRYKKLKVDEEGDIIPIKIEDSLGGSKIPSESFSSYKYTYHPYPEDNIPFYDYLYKDNLKVITKGLKLGEDGDICFKLKLNFSLDFVNNIIENKLYEDNEKKLIDNIIIRFINKGSEEDIIDDLLKSKIKFDYNFENFIKESLIIYIINFLIDYLQNKTNN